MKKGLLLVLGILGAYQLGYSENMETKVEKIQNVEVKQNQVQTQTHVQTEVNPDKAKEVKELDEEAEENNKAGSAQEVPKKPPKEPKVKNLTPAQERRLDARTRKNKEKKMTLDEKLDFQILKMERVLKNLEKY